MSDVSFDAAKHVRTYLMVFGALAILTVITVAVGYLSLPIGAAVVVALLIASVKGSLVASFFMHLISEKKIIFWLLIVTVIILAVLFGLLIGSFYDQWRFLNVT